MFKIEGRPSSLFQGPLENIPGWISEAIQRAPAVEHAGEFISLMRDIVQELTQYLPTSGEYPSFFEHIIAMMPRGQGQVETARKASAYLLLNQLVFYRILSEGRGYERIDRSRLRLPGDLKRLYFNRVLEDDYQAVFNFDVASLFPDDSFKFILDMIKILDQVQPELFTRDLLGNVFHQLIPEEVRKPVAAYYTNPMAARLLSKLSINSAREKVADFACGSGTLLMAAYERKAELLDHEFSQEDHRAFIEEDLTGVDIMPFAAHLAVIQLALKNPVYWTDKVRVAVYDSTTLKPMQRAATLQMVMPKGQTKLSHFLEGTKESQQIHEGAVSPKGAGQGFVLDPVDVVVMNPPFTKKQFIDPDFRSILTDRFSDYSSYINNEQAYWSYFVLLADRFLKDEGRIALVLPATFLRQPTYSGIRELLRKSYTLQFVITTGYRSAFSESAGFREALLIARKNTADAKSKPTLFALLSVFPEAKNVAKLTKALASSYKNSDTNLLEDFGRGTLIEQEKIRAEDDWFAFIPGEEQQMAELSEVPCLSPLAQVVPKLIQGLRLNRQEPDMQPANTMLSYEREESTMIDWKVLHEDGTHIIAQNLERAVEVKVPKNAVVISTRTPTGMDKMLVDRTFDYVVIKRFQNDREFWNKAQADRILRGRNQQVRARSAYMIAAGRGNVNLAAGGTRLLAFCSKKAIAPTWALWSLRTDTFEDAKLLTLWWNSTFMLNQLLGIRAEVGGAWGWFGKKPLQSLPVLDPRKLTATQRQKLLSLFDELSEVSFPSLISQLAEAFPGRLKLDATLAQVLGIPKYKEEDSLRDLYSSTATRLGGLKALMSRK